MTKTQKAETASEKLFALHRIIIGGDVIARRTVFTATPAEARQFAKQGAARPATPGEVKAAEAAFARSQGQA